MLRHKEVAFGSNKMMKKEDEKRIRQKIKFFYDEKCRVHVNRFDKTFWNGLILNKKSEDVWDFHDDKLGECLLFLGDIYDINLCNAVEE